MKFDKFVAKILRESNNPTYTGPGSFQTDASNKGGQPVASPTTSSTNSNQQAQQNSQTGKTAIDNNKKQEFIKQLLTDKDFINRFKNAFNDPNTKIDKPEDIIKLFQ